MFLTMTSFGITQTILLNLRDVSVVLGHLLAIVNQQQRAHPDSAHIIACELCSKGGNTLNCVYFKIQSDNQLLLLH